MPQTHATPSLLQGLWAKPLTHPALHASMLYCLKFHSFANVPSQFLFSAATKNTSRAKIPEREQPALHAMSLELVLRLWCEEDEVACPPTVGGDGAAVDDDEVRLLEES